MATSLPTKESKDATESLKLPTEAKTRPPHPADTADPTYFTQKTADVFREVRGLDNQGCQIFNLNPRFIYLVCLHLSHESPKLGAQLQYSLNDVNFINPTDAVWIDYGSRQLGNFAAALPFPVSSLRLLVWDGVWTLQTRRLNP
ncbi:MAG: hypothetical protein INF43_02465 [Alphaproteobacteria bacterium]|nr:hypothetical protein [Alphaproteobacteria bacterium]